MNALLALLLLVQDSTAVKKLATLSAKEFESRREAVMKGVAADVIVIPAAKLAEGEEGIDSNTPLYDFKYLANWHTSGSCLVLVPAEKKTILFTKEDDLKAVSDATGIKDVLPYEKLAEFVKEVVRDETKVAVRTFGGKNPLEKIFKDNDLDPEVVADRKVANAITGLRQIKTDAEAAVMQAAADATNEAHKAAMRKAKAGMNEGDLQKIIEDTFEANGCHELGFPSICGSGKNGTILHYMSNNQEAKDGTVIVCDIGAAWLGYSADITRTIPLNGKYTDEQRKIYQCVLDAQKAAEKVCKPGATWKELDDAARKVFEEREMTKWSYAHSKDGSVRHGLGHFVGLSVHDSGFYREPLKEGMVITIEPGYYDKDQAIGVRIEDQYLITKEGFIRMSAGAPREIDEIEKLMAED